MDETTYPLEQCPANGTCTAFTGYTADNNACTQVVRYKLEECTSWYTLEWDTCVASVQPVDVEELLVPTSWTKASAWSITNVSLDNAEATTDFVTGNYAWVSEPQIIIQQKTGNAALREEHTTESKLERTLTSDFVSETGKVAEMQGILDIKLIYLDWSGHSTRLSGVQFSKPVKIMIPVSNSLTGVEVRTDHGDWNGYGTTWLSLSSSATCSGWVAITSEYTGWNVPVSSGKAEIYTCEASIFVAYTETTKPSTPSGWGWSNPTYSCKNLPDNAVANNTSKPNSDTNYSYSTDTGAVCTFQCKTGYTRNEETSVCDKADSNAEGTGNLSTGYDNTNTEDLQKVLDDGFTLEFHYAYDFAFANKITTMPSIQEADMYGKLNRIAMAKMLSQYAINILGKTPDTNKECKFGDVSAELDAQYDNWVTLACQLWIMWINMPNNEFRPYDTVVRAEFGTALSRLLFGIQDGTTKYYTPHLAKLKEEWIITNDDPTLQELRGYVMLMLMRSAK